MGQRHQKTQTGNPHRLPVRQHVFPRRSIERFCNDSGAVEIQHVSSNKIRRAKPDDETFCAMRVWDAKSERGQKQHEDRFQALASDIINFRVTNIEQEHKRIIDMFFALWKTRAHLKSSERRNAKLNIPQSHRLTRDQEEILESNGYIFVNNAGEIPHHIMNGLEMYLRIGHELRNLAEAEWGILYAVEGSFIVPDYPVFTFVPITPRICLCANFKSTMVPKTAVTEINHHVKGKCVQYFFGRALATCP